MLLKIKKKISILGVGTAQLGLRMSHGSSPAPYLAWNQQHYDRVGMPHPESSGQPAKPRCVLESVRYVNYISIPKPARAVSVPAAGATAEAGGTVWPGGESRPAVVVGDPGPNSLSW